jgi:hypothetical protein
MGLGSLQAGLPFGMCFDTGQKKRAPEGSMPIGDHHRGRWKGGMRLGVHGSNNGLRVEGRWGTRSADGGSHSSDVFV